MQLVLHTCPSMNSTQNPDRQSLASSQRQPNSPHLPLCRSAIGASVDWSRARSNRIASFAPLAVSLRLPLSSFVNSPRPSKDSAVGELVHPGTERDTNAAVTQVTTSMPEETSLRRPTGATSPRGILVMVIRLLPLVCLRKPSIAGQFGARQQSCSPQNTGRDYVRNGILRVEEIVALP